MTPGSELPRELELSVATEHGEERRVHLALVGPSSQGWVYRTEDRSTCYRLLPIRDGQYAKDAKHSDDAPVARRSDVKSWMPLDDHGRPRQTPAWVTAPGRVHIAPIVRADQTLIGGTACFFVEYGSRVERTLVDVLADRDPMARLDHLIPLLWCIPAWWDNLHEGLLPMPADIVFTADGQPWLLPMPFWRFPDVESVFAAPARGLYLAPEYVRGCSEPTMKRNMDTFAIGALLQQCFSRAPSAEDSGAVLLRAANGSLWTDLSSDLPYWLQQLDATREAQALVHRMLDPNPRVRSAFDPLEWAAKLAHCKVRMEPKAAIEAMVATHRLDQAFGLLQDILLADDSYDMLLLAGKVARQALRLLEAIDFYEKAIIKAPQRLEAYREQFSLLVLEEARPWISRLTADSSDAGAKVDDMVRRDFSHLDEDDRTEELELEMTQYLLWRRRYDTAAAFAYSRLFDDKKTFLWWKFWLRLAFVEVEVAWGKLSEAKEELVKIQTRLRQAHQEGRVDAEELSAYGPAIERLEEEIKRRRVS